MARYEPRHRAGSVRGPRRPRVRWVGVGVLAVAAAGIVTWQAALTAEGARLAGKSTTTAPAPSSAPPSTTTTEPPPRTATLLFGGDVLIHEGVWRAAATGAGGYDFSAMFEPITPLVQQADLALCHLEVTLARPGDVLAGYPRFRAPAPLARDLAEAGFDGCSVASNHALDYGEAGVASTLDALDAAHLGHSGTARSPEEDQRPARYDAGGIRVTHLSYAYGFNGFVRPAGKEWLADAIDPAAVVADARAARQAGAELVVVSLHWGNEYAHEVTEAQRAVAEALAAEPGVVDLVVGHHAHVVQPISKVGELWVVWGMGNLLSNNAPRCCRPEATDGVLVAVTIGDRTDRAGVGVTAVSFTPTWNERVGFRVLPAAETLAGGVLDPALAADLRTSYLRTTGHVLALADGSLPVAPGAALPG